MSESVVPIRRALLSVHDKRGLAELARSLAAAGVELLASGGTRTALAAIGLEVTDVAEYTGQPEVLGGRVKTLHPKIHAGILARRDVPDDLATLQAQGFPPIDLVVVNLYPFEATIARPDATLADAIENIDIGGPTLIRAAAKNHEHVAVLTGPEQYESLNASLHERGGTTLADRRGLALAAFQRTASYDRAVADYLATRSSADATCRVHPGRFLIDWTFASRSALRCDTARTRTSGPPSTSNRTRPDPTWPRPRSRHGKELSYNNLLDLDSALRLVRQFAEPAACILKHNNPCGAATAETPASAFERAYEGDPLSAFGGIVAMNRTVDRATAERMCAARAVPRGDPRARLRRRRPGVADHQTDAGGAASGSSTSAHRSGPKTPPLGGMTCDGSRAASSSRIGTGSRPIQPPAVCRPAARRPRPSAATWPSPGASVRRSSRTRSSWPPTDRSSAWAPAR